MAKKVQSYNQSLMKASACGFRFQRMRAADNKKHRGGRDTPTTMGRAFHRFAELYYQHCKKVEQGTDLTAVAGLVRQSMAGSGLAERDAEDLAFLAEKLAGMEIVPLATEVHLEEVVKTPDGRFFGTPDLWSLVRGEDGPVLEVVDRKSWRRIPTLAELKVDTQLWLYAGIIIEEFFQQEASVTAVRLVWRLPRYSRDVTLDTTREEVAARMVDFRKKADELDVWTDDEPAAGDHCTYCECAADCPLVEGGQVQMIEDAAVAQEAAERIVAMRAMMAGLVRSLKDWCNVNGPIDLPGLRWDFWPSGGRKYDPMAVYKFLTEAGVPPKLAMSAFGTTAKKIASVCKKAKLDDEAKAEAVALGEETLKTQFKAKKVAAGGADAEEDGSDDDED